MCAWGALWWITTRPTLESDPKCANNPKHINWVGFHRKIVWPLSTCCSWKGLSFIVFVKKNTQSNCYLKYSINNDSIT